MNYLVLYIFMGYLLQALYFLCACNTVCLGRICHTIFATASNPRAMHVQRSGQVWRANAQIMPISCRRPASAHAQLLPLGFHALQPVDAPGWFGGFGV